MATSADNGDELVRQARHDSQALGRLYDRHHAGLYRYCLHRLFVREVAEDISSSVFLEVARCMPRFAGQTEEDFRNWLFALANNLVMAHIRSSVRRRALLEAAVAAGRVKAICHSSAHLDDPDRLDWPHLYQALASLSDREQAVVTLRAFEQLSFAQVGRIMRISEGNARVLFARALQRLRARLEKSMGSV